jgi:amino acid transporter
VSRETSNLNLPTSTFDLPSAPYTNLLHIRAWLVRNHPTSYGKGKGTPIAVNTMTGIVSTITMAAAILISEFSSGGSLSALFTVVIGFTISTTTLSYLFIFPTYLILRYKYPNVHRPYTVPGGIIGAWIVTLFPLAYAAVGSYFMRLAAGYPNLSRRGKAARTGLF